MCWQESSSTKIRTSKRQLGTLNVCNNRRNGDYSFDNLVDACERLF
jgi:hypothetical protein